MDIEVYTVSLVGLFNVQYHIHRGEQLLYTVERSGPFWSKTFNMYDANREVVLTIVRPLTLGGYKFELLEEERLVGIAEQRLFSKKVRASLADQVIVIDSNLWQSEFTFLVDRHEAAKVSRKRMSRKKAYGIAIPEGYDHELYLALLIVIIKIQRLRAQS